MLPDKYNDAERACRIANWDRFCSTTHLCPERDVPDGRASLQLKATKANLDIGIRRIYALLLRSRCFDCLPLLSDKLVDLRHRQTRLHSLYPLESDLAAEQTVQANQHAHFVWLGRNSLGRRISSKLSP